MIRGLATKNRILEDQARKAAKEIRISKKERMFGRSVGQGKSP